MIVKIQKPLCSSGELEALMYNEDKSIFLAAVYDEQVAKMFSKGENKIYHEAIQDDLGMLLLGDRVPDQNW